MFKEYENYNILLEGELGVIYNFAMRHHINVAKQHVETGALLFFNQRTINVKSDFKILGPQRNLFNFVLYIKLYLVMRVCNRFYRILYQ